MVVYIIEDELHAEPQRGEFLTLSEAVEELQRRASLPRDKPPNVVPCVGWRGCGREYAIVEYDSSLASWRELSRTLYLEVSANGIRWLRRESRNPGD